ncbi:hypothetical protein HIM_04249 [Hirsutella minnesotensis 3608]|uniref:Alcohol acetyltransferase n=1 Tax=Hirsutella minnesotensis 3608 TaxID=1043627 RepID=A0A0F7ZQ27_9HYPO|nr:hypothetical protein HIM_04249 [Hirsutella minnesotensis 3608]
MSPSREGPRPAVIRRLGCMELFFSTLQTVDYYFGTAISCRYAVPHWPVESRLRASVQAALARTVLQHAVLRVGIINETSRAPSFVRQDSVNLGRHLEWLDDSTEAGHDAIFNNAFQAQLDSKFSHPESRPPWRVVVLPVQVSKFLEVIFAWNHALADGVGGAIFHETLLHHLNATPDGSVLLELENGLLDIRGSRWCFPPSQNSLRKHPIGLKYAISTLWRLSRPTPHDTFATWAPIRERPCKTQLRSIAVDDQVLQKVLAACRENMTTLTGLLHGIALVSLAARAPSGKASGLSGQTALNMRRLYSATPCRDYQPVQAKTMANAFSVMSHTFDAATVDEIRSCPTTHKQTTQRFVWSAAASVRDEIRQALGLGVKNKMVGLMSMVPDWRPFIKYKAKIARVDSWLVTNLGVLGDCAEKGSWSISRGFFAVSAEVIGAALHICPVSIQGQELCVAFTWQDEVVDTRVAEQLVSDVGEWLMYIGGFAESDSKLQGPE